MEKMPVIAMIMAVVVIVLLILTFFFPWYNLNVKSSMDYGTLGDGEEYVYEMEADIDVYYDKIENTSEYNYFGWEGSGSGTNSLESGSELTTVMSNARIIAIVAIIMIGIAAVGIYMMMSGKIDKKIVMAFIVVGFVMAILAPIYMMMTLPAAIEEDGGIGEETPVSKTLLQDIGDSFFGSKESNVEGVVDEARWGGVTSWYLGIIAGVVGIVTIVPVYMYRPQKEVTEISVSEIQTSDMVDEERMITP